MVVKKGLQGGLPPKKLLLRSQKIKLIYQRSLIDRKRSFVPLSKNSLNLLKQCSIMRQHCQIHLTLHPQQRTPFQLLHRLPQPLLAGDRSQLSTGVRPRT